MQTMARPKKQASKPPEPEMKTHGWRMTAAYSIWLEQFARSQRMSVATLIDRAVADDAERKGFKAPPDRVP